MSFKTSCSKCFIPIVFLSKQFKSSTTYSSGGSGPSSNVSITGPLNGDGSVKVGGSFILSGTANTNLVNIDNKYLDNGALKVAVENYPNVYIVGVSNDGNGNLDVNLNATKYYNANRSEEHTSELQSH